MTPAERVRQAASSLTVTNDGDALMVGAICLTYLRLGKANVSVVRLEAFAFALDVTAGLEKWDVRPMPTFLETQALLAQFDAAYQAQPS